MADLSGNLGNWSEVYALLDVLVNRKIKGTSLIAGDFNYVDYDVTDARRTVGGKELIITHTPNKTVSNSITGAQMPHSQIVDIKDAVREAMTAHKKKKPRPKGGFTIPAATPFTDFLEINALGAGSNKKTDIELGIRDPASNMVVVSRFSIKSLVGGSPTLLNASQATNFVYDVKGITDDQVHELNAIYKKKVWLDLRLAKLKDMGGSLEYSNVWNKHHQKRATSPFYENLRMIDSYMPEIMGEAILQWKLHGKKRLEVVAESLVAPLAENYGLLLTESQIRFKLACLLEASALGMNNDTDWDGKYAVSDGMLLVDDDFSTRLIRTRTHDGFREGLLRATRFETADSRNKFGEFYSENGRVKVKLNLQIRYDSPGSDEHEQP